MADKNSKSTTTSTQVPSWLEPSLKSYVGAVSALGEQDPSKYVAPASSLQKQAFARASRLGGMTTPAASAVTSPTPATRPNPGGSTGVPTGYGQSLYTKLGVTPASTSGNATASGLDDGKTDFFSSEGAGNNDIAGRYLGLPADPVSRGISKAVGFDITDPLGLNRQKATNAYDIWDTPQNNAEDAGKFDYARYYEENPDVQQWLAETPTKDPRGYSMAVKSYDVDGDGKLSGGEAAQWHFENAGQKEGRKIYTPQESYAMKEAARRAAGETSTQPTADSPEVQSWLDDTNAFLGDSPYIDPNLLYQEAIDLARRGANTDVKYRTFDQFDPSVYYNPYEKDVVDATGAYYDEQLAKDISGNQARATMNNTYGGSRHGVADAELRRTSNLDKAKMMADLRYQGYEGARGQFNTDSAGLFAADTANRDNLYKGAGFLGDIGTTASATERANIQTMLQAGEYQRALDQAARTGDLALLQQIGSLLGINVNSFFGSQTTTPGQNGTMGALGGAASGAAAGSYFGPWGTAIGAIGGGLLGSGAV